MYNTYYSLGTIEWLQNITCKIGITRIELRRILIFSKSINGNSEFIGHKIEIPVVISENTKSFI